MKKSTVNLITNLLGFLAILAGIFAPIIVKDLSWYYPAVIIILGILLIYLKNGTVVDATMKIIEKLK